MNVDRFYSNVLNYTLQIFCAFDSTLGNKVGIIVFSEQVKVAVPLAEYTEDEWFAEVYRLKDSRYTDDPICCSCCTPTGDAFVLAEQHMAERATHETQLVFVITDGLPSNNNPDTGGQPEWWFRDPETGYDPALYNTKAVPEAAWKLKQSGRRVMLLGVPNKDKVSPDRKYFAGGYPNEFSYCPPKRAGVKFCAPYYTQPIGGNPLPHFPIVSLPADDNVFTQTIWNDDALLGEIVEKLCFVPGTDAPTPLPTSEAPSPSPATEPTSKRPTKQPTQFPTKKPKSPPSRKPTKEPTSPQPTQKPTTVVLDQVDLTILVDTSKSMTYYDDLCTKVLETFPNPPTNAVPCWEVWIQFMTILIEEFLQIPAGPEGDSRELGWHDSFAGNPQRVPAQGLRVHVIGFACKNQQKTPLMYEFSDQLNGGPISSAAQLVSFLSGLREVVPDRGTCPHLAVEQAVKYLEDTDRAKYPLQSTLLLTDGVFYDGNAVPLATKGLKKYRALRYAVGVAIARDSNNKHGLTKQERETQQRQLSQFVDGNQEYFYNAGKGYDGLLGITRTIAESLPPYYFEQGKPPIPNYTFCGFRRKFNCASDGYRKGHCKWVGSADAQYKCKKKKK